MAASNKRKYSARVNYREGRIIEDVMRANSTISDGAEATDRIVRYSPDWNDARVAEVATPKIGFLVTEAAVRRFRVINIGKLPRGFNSAKSPAGRAPLTTAIMRLKHQVVILEQRLAAVEQHLIDRDGFEPPAEPLREIYAVEEVAEEARG